MPEELTQPVPVAPSAPVTSEPVAPTPAPSVSEHAKQYGENGTGAPGPDDDDGPIDDVVDSDSQPPQYRGSRAKSKQAAARINRLTAEKHELRQRIEALESRSKPQPEPVTPKVAYQAPKVEFNDPEPQLEQFADKDDPYGAWQRELARWDRRKERAEEQAQHLQMVQRQAQQESGQAWEQARASHQQRLIAAVQANPAHAQALQSVQVAPPPLLDWAIMLDKESASVALFLATHPTVLDEFVLMTATQPVTEMTVATTQRLLRQRMTAGTTGSVAASPLPNAPRPPNPVRTGLIRTGAEPPGPGSSIADHAKFFGPKAPR